ncbi:MAG: efflux RND transporter periplasmic adaptor subunit [Myxococcota bacterium]
MRRISRAAVAASWLLLGGCESSRPQASESSAGAEEAPKGQRVETERLQPTTFVELVDVNATVLTDGDVTLSARVSGTLERLAALGAQVEKGALVAELDPALARAALAQAEAGAKVARARARLARSRYERQKPLMEKEVISATEFEAIEAELDQADANVAQADATVRQAREQLRLTRVVAPRAGVVEARFAEVGEQLGLGTPILRLVDLSEVRVRGAVPERYAKDIRLGDKATVRFRAYDLPPRRSEISFLGQALDPRSRTFPVELRLQNEDGLLRPEMVARMVLEKGSFEDALSVPQTALLSDEVGNSVFVVEERDGLSIAERRRVETGARSSGRVVVTKGLEAGESVVIVGQTTLAGGEVVEVVGGEG